MTTNRQGGPYNDRGGPFPQNSSEHGPMYGVELIKTMPVGEGLQQMPSRQNLEFCMRSLFPETARTAMGYEVLLHHYQHTRRTLDAMFKATADFLDSKTTFEELHYAFQQAKRFDDEAKAGSLVRREIPRAVEENKSSITKG